MLMFSIKQVYDLQETDWELSAREKSLASARARLADESALVSARARLLQIESQLEDQSAARRQEEVSVQRLETRLQAAESRLYGGGVTNPREFSAHEEEMDFLKRQLSAEEDELLELMVEVEDLQSARSQARERLSRIESERKIERAELLASEEHLTNELGELGRTRNEMVRQIPAPVLSVYEGLLRARNGHAVAMVERGMCQGCRLALPTLELQRARTQESIVQCSSCRRILYLV